MKDELCNAFCAELAVRNVPAGLAVSTMFNGFGGEPLGFYLVGPDEAGRYRVEDDGTTVPYLEACGADLESQTRAEAFESLLEEYGAVYDEDRGELTTDPLPEGKVPHAALRFVALLLRIQDLALLTPERAASTFKEDALREIQNAIGDKAAISENESVVPGVADFPADIVLRAPNHDPVAVYFALTEQRVLEAVVAQMTALHEAHIPLSVIALLEKDTSITKKMRQYAHNRLTAVPIFMGDERAAVDRIRRATLGRETLRH